MAKLARVPRARGATMMDKVSFGDEAGQPRGEDAARVGAVFSVARKSYDVMNDLMSAGHAPIVEGRIRAPGSSRAGRGILDMAGGTGDIAFRMARRRRTRHGQRISTRTCLRSAWNARRKARHRRPHLDRGRECRDVDSFADRSFDAYTIAFGIRNVTDIPAALREAHRVLKTRRALLLPRILDHANGPASASFYDRLFAHGSSRRSASIVAGDEDSYRYLDRIDPPLPATCRAFEAIR